MLEDSSDIRVPGNAPQSTWLQTAVPGQAGKGAPTGADASVYGTRQLDPQKLIQFKEMVQREVRAQKFAKGFRQILEGGRADNWVVKTPDGREVTLPKSGSKEDVIGQFRKQKMMLAPEDITSHKGAPMGADPLYHLSKPTFLNILVSGSLKSAPIMAEIAYGEPVRWTASILQMADQWETDT